jgi:uncharacterized protein Yka (UPF0111/DUF47 family)
MNDLYFPYPMRPRRGRASVQVARLVQRIKTLVAEQRDLAKKGCSERVEALEAEIDRLKWKLAGAVRRELSESAAV